MRKRTLIGLGLATVLVASLAACAPEAPNAPSGDPATAGNDTLRIGTATDVVNYNPLIGNSRSDYWITNLMYPHLLSIGDDGSKQASVAANAPASPITTATMRAIFSSVHPHVRRPRASPRRVPISSASTSGRNRSAT